MNKTLQFIHLNGVPILEQLRLEEALLRTDHRNFCIVNRGSPRAIVMGISGDAESLLHTETVQKDSIPVIRRFSGGGTVIVDEQTVFITFILAKETVDVSPFPEPLMRWSASLYEKAWQLPHFSLRENDYCLGDKKCGGNAQYIKKDRWLHHTSFLWDYTEKNMSYLKLPPKRPTYRLDRPHSDFLVRLKDHFIQPEEMIQKLKNELVKQLYIEDFDWRNWESGPHRQATELLKEFSAERG